MAWTAVGRAARSTQTTAMKAVGGERLCPEKGREAGGGSDRRQVVREAGREECESVTGEEDSNQSDRSLT